MVSNTFLPAEAIAGLKLRSGLTWSCHTFKKRGGTLTIALAFLGGGCGAGSNFWSLTFYCLIFPLAFGFHSRLDSSLSRACCIPLERTFIIRMRCIPSRRSNSSLSSRYYLGVAEGEFARSRSLMRHATLDSRGRDSTGIRITKRSIGYLMRGLLAWPWRRLTTAIWFVPLIRISKTGFHRCGIMKMQLLIMNDWSTVSRHTSATRFSICYQISYTEI